MAKKELQAPSAPAPTTVAHHPTTHHAATHQAHVLHEPPVSVRTYWLVFIALMVLLAATVAATGFEQGPIAIVIAITIAVIKAVLILLFFMHVKYSSRLIWLFSGASFLWFGLLVLFIFADLLTRPILPTLGK